MSDVPRDEPPFEGGSQPVPNHPPEMPHGRGFGQILAIVLGLLTIAAAGMYIFYR